VRCGPTTREQRAGSNPKYARTFSQAEPEEHAFEVAKRDALHDIWMADRDQDEQ